MQCVEISNRIYCISRWYGLGRLEKSKSKSLQKMDLAWSPHRSKKTRFGMDPTSTQHQHLLLKNWILHCVHIDPTSEFATINSKTGFDTVPTSTQHRHLL